MIKVVSLKKYLLTMRDGDRESGKISVERLIESMMGFRPRQGNLRLVFRLFSLMRGFLSIRLK